MTETINDRMLEQFAKLSDTAADLFQEVTSDHRNVHVDGMTVSIGFRLPDNSNPDDFRNILKELRNKGFILRFTIQRDMIVFTTDDTSPYRAVAVLSEYGLEYLARMMEFSDL